MSEVPSYDQAAAIPFRLSARSVEFCLITTASGRRWTIPKGIIDPGESAPETALKEAVEEGGLHGRIVGAPLGDYEYQKWGATLRVQVFALEVTHAADEWEEMTFRERRWVSEAKVRLLMNGHPARDLLEILVARVRDGDI